MKDETLLGRLWRGVSEVVFPPVCVHCRALVDEGTGFRHLCANCIAQIEWVKEPHCTTCGHPFYGVMEGNRMCVKCDGLHPAYREGRTAVIFKGPLRSLVIELKYHRGLHVLSDVAEIFRRSPHVLELARGAMHVAPDIPSLTEYRRVALAPEPALSV